jgi:hypothetical protein
MNVDGQIPFTFLEQHTHNVSPLPFFNLQLPMHATFNNISVISWRSVLLVEGTGGRGKNHRPVARYRQTLCTEI